ncbi:MAG: metallophosphoesterase [Sphingobacteriaceae bacterium]|nr:metallophosphoesterase [Sphingobacteriaceae bacterium]
MGRLPVLILVNLILLAFDYYCLNAILAVFKKWKPETKRKFKIIYWLISIGLVVGVFVGIYVNIFLSARAIILVAFFLTTTCKICLLPFLLIDELRMLFLKAVKKIKNKKTDEPIEGEKISRSAFLTKAGLVTAAVPLTSLTWGIVSGAYDYQIKRVKLVLPNLPKAFEGIKLGQISDIHSGSFYDKKAVKGGIEMMMNEKPDFIFFTGDLVNNLTKEVRDYQDVFAKLKAPLGVYSTLGNHDYGDYHFGKESSPAKIKNLQDMILTHKIMGFDLLMNENRRLKVDGEEIGVLGVENWGTGRFPKYGKMEMAVQNTDDLPIKLLLSHDPSHWRGEILPKYPQIDVTFSGHTHGMQFGVQYKEYQWSPAKYIYKEWSGLYHEQNQQLYVNVGFGFLGYPGRVGILPEITIFELTRGV